MSLWRKFVLGFVPRKKVGLPPCQRLSTSVQYDSCAARRGAQQEPNMTDLKKLKEDFKAYFADLKENAKEEGFKVCRKSEWEFFLIAQQEREAN
jgi:hypothetical protein